MDILDNAKQSFLQWVCITNDLSGKDGSYIGHNNMPATVFGCSASGGDLWILTDLYFGVIA